MKVIQVIVEIFLLLSLDVPPIPSNLIYRSEFHEMFPIHCFQVSWTLRSMTNYRITTAHESG